jgi:hypothetical protein
VEDKLPIANELCRKLEEAGLCIWYSGKELKAGDSLERTILKALDESEFGVVILSPTYVERNWPMKEYYLLLAKEIQQRKVILPVLYNITAEELLKYDIAIADRWGIRYDEDIDRVVEKLLEVIKTPHATQNNKSWKKTLTVITAILFVVGVYFGYMQFSDVGPTRQVIEEIIANRIRELNFDIDKEHKESLSALHAKPSTIDELQRIFSLYTNVKTNYRNSYLLDNGIKTVQSRTNVEEMLKRDLDSLAPAYSYNFSSPNIFLATKADEGKITEAHYSLLNTQPLSYSVEDIKILDNGDCEVTVSYRNNLRYIFVELLMPHRQSPLKRHYVKLKG